MSSRRRGLRRYLSASWTTEPTEEWGFVDWGGVAIRVGSRKRAEEWAACHDGRLVRRAITYGPWERVAADE